jgi:hypothetical protein
MVNTNESKKVLFRLKNGMKTDFSLALVKHGVGAQHVLEAAVERVIAFSTDNGLQPGEKKFLTNLFKRAKELQADAKLSS